MGGDDFDYKPGDGYPLSANFDRLQGRDDRRGRDRDKGRDHGRDRERDRPEKSKKDDRSRDRSASPKARKPRKTMFDVLPPGAPPGTIAPMPGLAPTGFSAGLAAPLMPGIILGMPSGMSNQSGGVQPPSQQATRHARRVYVGGLPPTANETSVATFFSHALQAIGGTASGGVGNAVVNVYINREKNFAFVEFRTVEETSNAMALDGIMFEGVSVRVRRPNDYNPAAAAALGASVPNPSLNLGAIGLSAGGVGGVTDAHERVFVGGLPYYLTEEQCKELLGSFGTIKSFDLVKDRDTGNSKGYGFVVYIETGITDIACQGLNGLRMGDRTLTVRRATEGQQGGGSGGMPLIGTAALMGAAAEATRVVCLREAVTVDELADEAEYGDIMDDMREECSKYGPVLSIQIPRPVPEQPNPTGLGLVIVEFSDVASSMRARSSLHGRKFGGKPVVATYMSEERHMAGDFDEDGHSGGGDLPGPPPM